MDPHRKPSSGASGIARTRAEARQKRTTDDNTEFTPGGCYISPRIEAAEPRPVTAEGAIGKAALDISEVEIVISTESQLPTS